MHLGVFSRGPALYSTRRLVEAARAAGHDVRVVDHTTLSPYLNYARPALLEHGKQLRGLDVVIPRIGANVTQRGAAVLRQLDVMGVPHTLDPAALLLARDKMSSLQALAAAGLPVPRTVLCFSVPEARHAARRMDRYPVVVKLLESTHGVGVALATSQYQLDRIVEGFLRFQDRVVIQEFVRESRGRDLRAFVVGGRIVAAMERSATEGEFRANIHRGATARPLELDPDQARIARAAARTVGVEIAGVDLLLGPAGPLLMEVNASPGLEGIEGTTGVDIAGAIVDYASKKVPTP